ncbi:MAG: hypothetical protein ABI553_01250 [Chloroflexota bacterium]
MSNHGFGLRRALHRTASLAAAMTILLAFGASGVAAARPVDAEVMDAQGIVHVRGAGHAGNAASNPNLLYHGGAIMTGSTIKSIFWGPSWSTSAGDKVTGLHRFYGGIGVDGIPYLNTNTEYAGTNGPVGTGVTYQGYTFDKTSAPRKAPSTSQVLAVVARSITDPVANGYYPVYSDQKRGRAGYCAWHSYGSINNVPVQFAFFFNLDGDPGCDPQDPGTIHSQGLEAVANVSGHELSEAVTDPRNGGWWDASGAENSDKCAWTFGGNVTIGGQDWKIQGNWSNAAYNTRSGYDGAGCIQTK